MIYVSTACKKNKFIRDSVVEIVKMGVRNIELSGGTKYYPEYLHDLMELKNKYNLNYLIHNYFPPPDKEDDFVLNFASSKKQTYSRSLILIKKAISITAKLGSTLYAFHPGYAVEIEAHKKGRYFAYSDDLLQSKKKKESLFYSRFDSLLETLVWECVPIAIENLFPFDAQKDYSLFSSPNEIIRFLKRYAAVPAVGLLLDLGHLNISSHYLGFDKIDFIEYLFRDFSDKVFEIHLSENNGMEDHHLASEANSWQISIIKENYSLLQKIPITLEWYSGYNSEEWSSRLKKIADFL